MPPLLRNRMQHRHDCGWRQKFHWTVFAECCGWVTALEPDCRRDTGPDAAAYGAAAGFPVCTRVTASQVGNPEPTIAKAINGGCIWPQANYSRAVTVFRWSPSTGSRALLAGTARMEPASRITGNNHGHLGPRSARALSNGARTEFRYRIFQYHSDCGAIVFRCRLL